MTATEDRNQDPLAEEADHNGRKLALRRVQERSFGTGWQYGHESQLDHGYLIFGIRCLLQSFLFTCMGSTEFECTTSTASCLLSIMNR